MQQPNEAHEPYTHVEQQLRDAMVEGGPAMLALADTLLERLGVVESLLTQNVEAMERRIGMLRAAYASTDEPYERESQQLRDALAALWLQVPCDPKKKSRKFPHGEIGVRAKAMRLEIVNAADAVLWAEDNASVPDLVKETIVRKPVSKNFAAYFKRTGDVPAGCVYHESTEQFFAKAQA